MVYEKDSYGNPIKTKNEFALESLQYALRLGIRPFKVCFDSKYSSSKLLNWLDNNKLTYYSQLASNRSFNGQQLKMHRFQPYAESGYLKGVGHRVSVASTVRDTTSQMQQERALHVNKLLKNTVIGGRLRCYSEI